MKTGKNMILPWQPPMVWSRLLSADRAAAYYLPESLKMCIRDRVHEIYQNVIRKHSSCGAADQYTQIHFTEHHGPGTDGFRGYDSSTHGFDTLNCSRGGEVLGYEKKCGAAERCV